MNKAPIVELLGLYPSDAAFPLAIFVVRSLTDKSSLETTIGEAIASYGDQDCHVQSIELAANPGFAVALGSSAANKPEAFLYDVQANEELGIKVHDEPF